MRRLLLAVTLFAGTADRAADRAALLSADRALATTSAVFTDSAVYLHPGAPLIRGATHISAFLTADTSLRNVVRIPAYADVSNDATLGYTYGWLRSTGERGKYLACWRKLSDGWRIWAYARTTPVPVPDSVPVPVPRTGTVARADEAFRGHADPAELLRADSAFAAMSVSRGGKAAFLAFASEDAVAFGGGAQMSEGRDAIASGFDGFPAGAVLEWWPLSAQMAGSGDLGCTVGEAMITSLHHYSKYLTIWKRQRNGSWKFVADGGNVRPAPASVSGNPPPED